MGFLSNRVNISDISAADHIYTWRAAYTYSHHGIFVGGKKVVHFTPRRATVSGEGNFEQDDPSPCLTFPDCGFRQPNSNVILSCLDCFLRGGSLYLFQYQVNVPVFLAKVRGGTCSTAVSDHPDTVIHRAMHLLHKGFGSYDVFHNNCEDFALYCKTGLLTLDGGSVVGGSGQASSVVGVPLAAIVSSPLKLLMPGSIGVAAMAVGMYCMCQYSSDIGVRADVVEVAVEDLAANLGTPKTEEHSRSQRIRSGKVRKERMKEGKKKGKKKGTKKEEDDANENN